MSGKFHLLPLLRYMHKKKKKKISSKHTILWTVLISVFLLGLGIWYVVRAEQAKRTKEYIAQYTVTGIDVSAHNGKIDFEKVYADSIKFVYIKCSEGASFHDKNFEKNFENARKTGIATGVYHFFRFDVNGTLQAQNMLNCLKGKTVDMPLAIDVEKDGNPKTQTDIIISRLQEMINYLEERNIPVIIYTNMEGFNRFYENFFANYPLWIARFLKPGTDIDWSVWQYSHEHEVPGIHGDVDMNVFCGTESDFAAWLGKYSF